MTKRARYIGNGSLAGKTALIRDGEHSGVVLAQFDDTSTGQGHGWHPHPTALFEVLEDPFDADKGTGI